MNPFVKIAMFSLVSVVLFSCKSRENASLIKSTEVQEIERETLEVIKTLSDLRKHASQYYVPQYDRAKGNSAGYASDQITTKYHVFRVTKLSRLIKAERQFNNILEKYDRIGLIPYDRMQKLKLEAWDAIEDSSNILDARTKRSNWFTTAVMQPFDFSTYQKRRNTYGSLWDYCQKVVTDGKYDFDTFKAAMSIRGEIDHDSVNYEALGYFFLEEEYRELLWHLAGQPEVLVPIGDLKRDNKKQGMISAFFWGDDKRTANKALCRSTNKPPKNYRGNEFWCPVMPPKLIWESNVTLEGKTTWLNMITTYSIRAVENLKELHDYLAGEKFSRQNAKTSDGVCPVVLDSLDHLRLEHGPLAYPFKEKLATSQKGRQSSSGQAARFAKYKINDKSNNSTRYLGATRITSKPVVLKQLDARIEVLKAVVEALGNSVESSESRGPQRERFLKLMATATDKNLKLEDKEKKIKQSLSEVMTDRNLLDGVDTGSSAGWGGHLSNHAKVWYEALSGRSDSYRELNKPELNRLFRLMRARLFQEVIEENKAKLEGKFITELVLKMFSPADRPLWKNIQNNGKFRADADKAIAAINK